jgi:uncharacterized protein YllA (UPF0747 family)
VEKLAGGAVAVVTGQQPVLFTGPLFCVYKAISAVQIALELDQAGIPAVPVFWVASEDHDYKEIEEAWLLDRDTRPARVAVDLSGPEPAPAGWLTYRNDVEEAVRRACELSPQSEFVPRLRELLAGCYRVGASPSDAFAAMMARLFAETDLTFIDPLAPALKSLARPIVDLAMGRNAELRAALQIRNKELAAAGYHEQVRVDEEFTGFFAFRGRARAPLRPHELDPGVAWSPNVLLRPVVQDTLLPTAAYIGGPAEVAYFAQAAAVYRTLEMPMPAIVPRINATLVEPRLARAAEKYGIELEDVLAGGDRLRQKAVGAADRGDIFERVRSSVDAEIESLRPQLSGVDATLAGALDTALQKVRYQVDALKGKYVTAAARRDQTLERRLGALSHALFPGNKPQERLLNIATFIARYGPEIVPLLGRRLRVDTHAHQVIEI